MVEYLSDHFKLTPEERTELVPSQKQSTVYNRTVWTNTYLKKAGLIISPQRGVIQITDRGMSVLAQNPQDLSTDYLNQFPEFVEFRTVKKQDSDKNETTSIELPEQDPHTVIDDAHITITKSLADDLLESIMQRDAYFFERLVVELLVKMGYSNESSNQFVTKKSGDEGIDGIIRMDKLGFDLIGVQAKRLDRATSVTRPTVQAFAGALGGKGITNGVFFTTSKFTDQAKQYNHTGIKIILIDGDELAKLMILHNVGVQIERTLEFKKVDIDFFEGF